MSSARTSRDNSAVRGHQRWSVYDGAGHRCSVYRDTGDMMTTSMIVTSDTGDHGVSRDQVSTIKSTNSYLSYRQPYMGWRSLERLKLSGGSLLSPEQRLAASLLNQVISA